MWEHQAPIHPPPRYGRTTSRSGAAAHGSRRDERPLHVLGRPMAPSASEVAHAFEHGWQRNSKFTACTARRPRPRPRPPSPRRRRPRAPNGLSHSTCLPCSSAASTCAAVQERRRVDRHQVDIRAGAQGEARGLVARRDHADDRAPAASNAGATTRAPKPVPMTRRAPAPWHAGPGRRREVDLEPGQGLGPGVLGGLLVVHGPVVAVEAVVGARVRDDVVVDVGVLEGVVELLHVAHRDALVGLAEDPEPRRLEARLPRRQRLDARERRRHDHPAVVARRRRRSSAGRPSGT